jgi:hypothetical protein
MRVGAKLAAAFFSSLALASLFALMVAYRVPYRWIWIAPLVAGSEPFLYRMSMTRAPSLSIILLGAGAYLILERRLVLLFLLSFVFVWTYSLFPLVLAFAAAHALAVYLGERRIDLWPVGASLGGIVAGMVINPYFPKNWGLLYEHLLMKLRSSYSVDVGIEWYPYDTWVIVGGSAVAFALYFLALAAFDYRSRLRDLKPLFFLIVSSMFLLMAFKSRRFIEYWPPFAVLFAAFTFSPALGRLDRAVIARMRDRLILSVAAGVAVAVSLVVMGTTLLYARADVRREASPFAYQGASEWIRTHTPKGAMIFNTDWDDFPMLFYYNPDNAYVAGLDPTYLYNRDPKLWKLYEKITLGDDRDPAPPIREQFGAEYVFTDNAHTAFLRAARESGDFEIVYEDEDTTVLRIKY